MNAADNSAAVAGLIYPKESLKTYEDQRMRVEEGGGDAAPVLRAPLTPGRY